jgi:L-lysine exporter family protein LysE/ArgO
MLFSAFSDGFLISLSLILAIGAQNVYVLKRGLLKEHVFLVALTCTLLDTILISAGVKGLGKFIEIYPSFLYAITIFGIIFLLGYGSLAFASAFKKNIMHVDTVSHKPSAKKVLFTLLSLSLLNPHVYLDTVVLIGAVGSKYTQMSQNFFIIGAAGASCVFFFTLAYASRVLIPLFQKPITWKFLDVFTAGVMFFIAYKLYASL